MNQPELEPFSSPFDFLFIGIGAANSLLILSLESQGLLSGKKIAIIEPEKKDSNDRVFCFWATEEELTNLNLSHLVSSRWDNIEINGVTKQAIKPLQYCHVQSIDLYQATQKVLYKQDVTRISARLTGSPTIISGNFEVKVVDQTFCAKKVFDSRPPTYSPTQKNQSHLAQSFFGWKIKSQKSVLDPTTMVMMDFNIPQNNFTQFVYILPFSEDTALFELTRFGEEKVCREEAEAILEAYVNKYLGADNPFEILDTEQGLIPMSSAKMQTEDLGPNWVQMGVSANMLKSSTGYAFHFMAEDAKLQMEAIKNEVVPIRKQKSNRFVFYDRLLLKILQSRPEYGQIIFQELFKNIPILLVLRFLREKTTILNELLIFAKLPLGIFIKAALKDILFQIARFPIFILPLVSTFIFILLSQFNLNVISWGILGVGFVTVGLSHGALDHLTSGVRTIRQLSYFIVGYLFKGALLGVVWYLFPDYALVIFIAYSAWHFGQADFKEWDLTSAWSTFFWGLIVLLTLLIFHFQELNWILGQIPNLKILAWLSRQSAPQIIPYQIGILLSGVGLAIFLKSKSMFFTLFYLFLSSFLPLLTAFGIYFVMQHSMQGWRHLRRGLQMSPIKLWIYSLPFSLGGLFLIGYFAWFAGLNYVGMFFIILSCLSIPHVFSMHRFYGLLKKKSLV